MSLAAFQRALAELTASPALVRAVRQDGAVLAERHDLSPRELARLNAIAASKGMAANCMLYRANRLAPVALNCPELCTTLGDDLNRLISAYWESEPTTDVHFLVETDRFCRFLAARDDLPPAAQAILALEHKGVQAKLAASASQRGRSAFTG